MSWDRFCFGFWIGLRLIVAPTLGKMMAISAVISNPYEVRTHALSNLHNFSTLSVKLLLALVSSIMSTISYVLRDVSFPLSSSSKSSRPTAPMFAKTYLLIPSNIFTVLPINIPNPVLFHPQSIPRWSPCASRALIQIQRYQIFLTGLFHLP